MITIKRLISPLGSLAVAATLLTAAPSFATTAMQCSQKLHSTLYGRSATAAELTIADPMSHVDEMMSNDEFIEKFSMYINAHMNWLPGDGKRQNPVYMAMKHYIFQDNQEKPWKELFTGGYSLYDNGYNPREEKTGYFSDRNWKQVYKGNEEFGYKLRTAYLILNNQIGLNLDALTVNSTGGSGRDARQDPDNVCVACHFNSDFALDRIAQILPLVDRESSDAQNLIEIAAPGPFNQLIYGQPVSSLEDLTAVLSTLDAFNTNACNIAFQFVFGRDHRGADKALFDQCVTEFKTDGRITTSVKHFLESDIFCQSEEG
ncbi:MAG TPA: hypothetical protein VIC26_04480 [Marinagarivorans sp.]